MQKEATETQDKKRLENTGISQSWLCMLKERNNTAHIYDGEAARKLTDRIITEFIPEFEELQSNIEKQYKNVLKNMQ